MQYFRTEESKQGFAADSRRQRRQNRRAYYAKRRELQKSNHGHDPLWPEDQYDPNMEDGKSRTADRPR